MGKLDTCDGCGSGREARSMVPYVPEPNGAQAETEWADELRTLTGVVCTECGYVLGVFDTSDPGEASRDRGSSRFRVDQELE